MCTCTTYINKLITLCQLSFIHTRILNATNRLYLSALKGSPCRRHSLLLFLFSFDTKEPKIGIDWKISFLCVYFEKEETENGGGREVNKSDIIKWSREHFYKISICSKINGIEAEASGIVQIQKNQNSDEKKTMFNACWYMRDCENIRTRHLNMLWIMLGVFLCASELKSSSSFFFFLRVLFHRHRFFWYSFVACKHVTHFC